MKPDQSTEGGESEAESMDLKVKSFVFCSIWLPSPQSSKQKDSVLTGLILSSAGKVSGKAKGV